MKKNNLSNKGVTLVELIIVIVIIGIIAGFSVISVGTILSNARESAQVINMNNINEYIYSQILLSEVDKESLFTYKRSGTAGDEYFSTFLEAEWEVKNGAGDEDNSNALGYTNSVSGKTGVVNWSDAPAIGDDLYCNQALYITTDSDASYDNDNPTTIDTCYAGSIILWYDDNNAEEIILYFVDNDALQGNEFYSYKKSDY